MKFKFSLESVLKVRKHEEEVQKQKLAEKLSEKKQLKDRRTKLEKQLKEHLGNADPKGFEKLHNLKRNRDYIHRVHEQMGKLNGSLKVIENSISQERDKLAAVHKERHIMEKVKEEEQEKFKEEVSRQQQKAMDEVAMQTYSQ